VRKRNVCMQWRKAWAKLHRCFVWEKKLMQWTKIFLFFLLKKNEVEGRGAQHISFCALNKVQYAYGSKALHAHSQR